MKNYIAGFRSNNPRNKKIASVYYIIITIAFIIGSSWKISDFMILLTMLIVPSLILNFISMIKRGNPNYPNKRRFFSTLIIFLIVSGVAGYTTSNIQEVPVSTVMSVQQEKNEAADSGVQQNKDEATDDTNNSKEIIENDKKEDTTNKSSESENKKENFKAETKASEQVPVSTPVPDSDKKTKSVQAPASKVEETPEPNKGGTVYWTPKGKSYHSTKSCPTLIRSKVVNSGTIQESGKDDPCDKCM